MFTRLREELARVLRPRTPPEDLRPLRPVPLQIAVWAFLLGVSLVLSLKNFHSFQIGVYQDDADYVVLTRSLIDSQIYGFVNAPGEPEPTKYPFGFPLLLVPFSLWSPGSPDALKLLSLFATLVNGSLLFWAWRLLSRTTSYWWGLAVAGLYLFSPLVIQHTRMVMSEAVFTTFCLATVMITERVTRSAHSRWWHLLLSATLLFTAYIRTLGVVLVVTVFAYLLWVKGRKAWPVLVSISTQMLLLAGIVVVATTVQSRDLLPLGYIGEFRERASSRRQEAPDPLLSRMAKTAGQHLTQNVAVTLIPAGGRKLDNLAQAVGERIRFPHVAALCGLLVSGVVLFGYARWLASEGLSTFLGFSVLYSGAILLWMGWESRFLYPILPQLFFALLLGIEGTTLWIASWLTPRKPSRRGFLATKTVAVAVLLITGLSLYKNVNEDNSRLHVGDLRERTRWLRYHSLPSDVVMTEEPQTDFLYSGRKTVTYQSFSSAQELKSYLHAQQVRYILFAPQLNWQAVHTPAYSTGATRTLALLKDLAAQNRVALVYSSAREAVKVFKVLAEPVESSSK